MNPTNQLPKPHTDSVSNVLFSDELKVIEKKMNLMEPTCFKCEMPLNLTNIYPSMLFNICKTCAGIE